MLANLNCPFDSDEMLSITVFVSLSNKITSAYSTGLPVTISSTEPLICAVAVVITAEHNKRIIVARI